MPEKLHMPRRGSIWRNKLTSQEVRIQFKRHYIIAYIYNDATNCGGLLPENDFHSNFEWVRGR